MSRGNDRREVTGLRKRVLASPLSTRRSYEMATVTERFTKLGEQIEAAERNLNDTASEDRAELQRKADKARQNADDHAMQMQAKAQQSSERLEDQWKDLINSWE